MACRTSPEVHAILCSMVKQIRSKSTKSQYDTDYFIVDHWNRIHDCAIQMYTDYAKADKLQTLHESSNVPALFQPYLVDLLSPSAQ